MADLRVFSRALEAGEALAMMDAPCVMGEWTEWGECVWDPCHDVARNPPNQRGPRPPLEVFRYRTREVAKPAAGAGGAPCGVLEEKQSCGSVVSCDDPARRSQHPNAHTGL